MIYTMLLVYTLYASFVNYVYVTTIMILIGLIIVEVLRLFMGLSSIKFMSFLL